MITSKFFVLVKKELREGFTSPLIYILSALFNFVLGWLFFNYLVSAKELTTLNIKDSVITPIFGNINFLFLFICPLLTMRSFSEEKKNGTLDLILNSKLTETDIIMGKVLSNTLMAIFMLGFTLIFSLVLSFTGFNDWGLVISTYLGIILSIIGYTMVGIFCSSLTDNQIVAAVLTFSLLLGSMILVITMNASSNYLLAQMVQYLTLPYHYEAFSRGVLRSYSFFYFISFYCFFYLLTQQSLRSRRW